MILTYGTGLANLLRREKTGYTSGVTGGPSYTRESVWLKSYANNTREMQVQFPAQGAIGFCGHYKVASRTTWENGQNIFTFTDSVTNYALFVIEGRDNESIHFVDYTGSSAGQVVRTEYPAPGVWYRIDMQLKIHETEGYIRFYIDGNLMYERTGSTTRGGTVSSIDHILLGGYDGAEVCYLGAMFVTDEEDIDTRDIEMFQHTITGAGRHQEMLGDYMNLVNYAGYNDGTQITATTANQTHSVAIDGLPSTLDSYKILAVGVDSRVSSDSKGAYKTALVIDDGANIVESAEKTGDGFYRPQIEIFNTAPDGAPWDHAKVENLEIGIRSK